MRPRAHQLSEESALFIPDEEATRTLGALLGQLLPFPSYLAAEGHLGAGKTCFAQGLAAGLGVDFPEEVRSPTFAILQRHEGPRPFAHIDLYRLGNADELEYLGLEELIEGHVSYVEWPSRAPELAPPVYLKLTLAASAEGRLAWLQVVGSDSAQFDSLRVLFYQQAIERGFSLMTASPATLTLNF
ncbi:MAG: tRNA (adenosine(37)-N6)-threonylcarbamoyltransferase complex ATPase subunit type 1 TsaE [Myxococcota bacterium]|nr:tRNA (adenosine(37)-N6)-threonylcarbamoyltransferase complex ATPase subunit type 1 TsaE [Myxococcota bacterium]